MMPDIDEIKRQKDALTQGDISSASYVFDAQTALAHGSTFLFELPTILNKSEQQEFVNTSVETETLPKPDKQLDSYEESDVKLLHNIEADIDFLFTDSQSVAQELLSKIHTNDSITEKPSEPVTQPVVQSSASLFTVDSVGQGIPQVSLVKSGVPEKNGKLEQSENQEINIVEPSQTESVEVSVSHSGSGAMMSERTEYIDPNIGTEGDDCIQDGDGDSIMRGLGGNDILMGGDGGDCIFGDDGDDQLFGEQGDDIIEGGVGNDVIYSGSGDDCSFGEEGDDIIFGEEGNDFLFGGAGSDRIVDRYGTNYLDGGSGDDYIYGMNGQNEMVGGDGNDLLYSYNDQSTISGGAGADTIYSYGTGIDTIDAGIGNDTVIIENGSAITNAGMEKIKFISMVMWPTLSMVE